MTCKDEEQTSGELHPWLRDMRRTERVLIASHYLPYTIQYTNDEPLKEKEDNDEINNSTHLNKLTRESKRMSFISSINSLLGKEVSMRQQQHPDAVEPHPISSLQGRSEEEKTYTSSNSNVTSTSLIPSLEILNLEDEQEDSPLQNETKPNLSDEQFHQLKSSGRTFSITLYYGGNSGLTNAVRGLKEALVKRKNHVIPEIVWVGRVPTEVDEKDRESVKEAIDKASLEFEQCVPVWMNAEMSYGFYNRFCKYVLWPVFHTILPNYVEIQSFAENSWKDYVSANQTFAHKLAETYRLGDLIWINGYHLMLVPQMLKEMIPDATVGFFLHVPFPSSEIFRCLHVRKEVLIGMLAADIIGFQTYTFARQFLQTCGRILGCEIAPDAVEYNDRSTSIHIVPNGIDYDQLVYHLDHPTTDHEIQSLRGRYKNVKILFARDKLDSTKGIKPRLLSFERFLSLYPVWVGKVILIQVAATSIGLNDSHGQITEIVSRINGTFGSLEYIPVVYLQKSISYHQYLALLTMADACIITTLKDGMNLMALEYIVAQRHAKNPLILSEFSSIYGSLHGVLPINPWDYKVNEPSSHRWLFFFALVYTQESI
jgi:trehalose-6-phosphate synthase